MFVILHFVFFSFPFQDKVRFRLDQRGFWKGLVLGHSFVAGLSVHLAHSLKVNAHLYFSLGKTLTRDLQVFAAQKLKVSDNFNKIFLYGQNGATVKSFQIPMDLIQKEQFDAVVIDLGSNDIVQNFSPQMIVADIVALASQLLKTGVPLVGILSVVPRIGGLRDLSEQDFNSRMEEVNTSLKKVVLQVPGLFFQRQKGFYENEQGALKTRKCVSEWSRDGIHPNDKEGVGRAKYINSIRLAFSQAIRLANEAS